MSPLCPTMIAAPIGPMPYTSVTDVFDASTAVTVRVRVSARAWSRKPISVTNWWQVATRSTVIGLLMVTPARSCVARMGSGTVRCRPR